MWDRNGEESVYVNIRDSGSASVRAACLCHFPCNYQSKFFSAYSTTAHGKIYFMLSIADAVDGNTSIKQFENVLQSFINQCICQVKYAGICLAALSRKQTDSLRTETDWRLDCGWVRHGNTVDHKVSDTWAAAHLVLGVNLLPRPHMVFIGATHYRVDPCL